MAWTNCVSFPGAYNVSNVFTIIGLYGQVKWSSCNKLALSQTFLSTILLLGVLLEPSLSSRVEREEMLNTPLWGASGRTRTSSATSFTAEAHTAAAGGSASATSFTAGQVEAEKGGRNRTPFHLRTHQQPRRSTPTTPWPCHKGIWLMLAIHA